MWEDDTYRTSQSDDTDTSPGARLFNMWMTTPYRILFPANQVFHVFDSLLIAIRMAVLVTYTLAGCLHMRRLLAEQGGLTEQISDF